jgi:hypothetical protein
MWTRMLRNIPRNGSRVWGMVITPVCLSTGEARLTNLNVWALDWALMRVIHRNMSSDDAYSIARHEGEMGIRISLGTYRLFHESGTEWTMTRSRGREEDKLLEERARQREEERRRRLGAILQ